MYTKFIQLTGYANLIAGLLLLAFWYLYAVLLPYGQLTDATSIEHILCIDCVDTFCSISGTV